MSEASKGSCRRVDGGTLIGPLWFAGWLFTIGYLKLTFWKAVIGLVIWPYFMGVAQRPPI